MANLLKRPAAATDWRFRRWLGAPRRLARRRGFGIHSPFAFDFVRRVINQPCRYYCYPLLDEAARRTGIRRSVLRLVFRVALFFQPCDVRIFGDADGYDEAVREALPDGCDRTGPSMMVVAQPVDGKMLDDVLACVASGGIVVIAGRKHLPDVVRSVWVNAARGMMFRGSDVAVYVGMQHLPRQLFNIWI